MPTRAFRTRRAVAVLRNVAETADLLIEVSLSNLAADTVEEAGIAYRVQDAGHYWAAYVDDGDNLAHLSKVIAGVETSMATLAWPPTDTAELRVLVQANRHRFYVGARLMAEVTDSDLSYALGGGLFWGGSTAPRFDNFFMEGL